MLTTIDRKSLGAFRVCFSLVLLLDVLRRLRGSAVWLAADGLLWHNNPRPWSLFNSLPLMPALALAMCGIVYIAFLLGWRTRWVSVLVFICTVSLHNRDFAVERSGEKVLDLLALWTLFLPLGDWFSLDARREGPPKESSVRSLAVLALLVQFAGIYFYAGVQKNGITWREGSAIHYLLYRNDIVTWFGVAIRAHVPLWASWLGSYATVLMEVLLPLLILWPITRAHVLVRRIAIALQLALHLGISVVADIGIYQPAMLLFCVLQLGPEEWAWLAARLPWLRSAIVPVVDKRSADSQAARRTLPTDQTPRLWLHRARELTVAVLITGAIALSCNQNDGVRFLHHDPLPVLEAAMTQLGLSQAWSRFAPDVPTTFRMLVVDATTADGRHIDPVAYEATGYTGPPLTAVPARLGYDTFWHNYSRMVGAPGYRAMLTPLTSSILRHHERTGQPEDRIVAFSAYGLVDSAPSPGAEAPPPGRFDIMRYP